MAEHPAKTDHYLLYDADCHFCQRWVEWAKRRGAEAAVAFLPCQHAVDLRLQAGISEEQCGHSAFFVRCNRAGGIDVRRAAAAINEVLALLPGARNLFWRGLSTLYHFPGMKQIEECGYRWIASHRHRLGGRTCKVK